MRKIGISGKTAAEQAHEDEPKVKTREKQTEHRRPQSSAPFQFPQVSGANWGNPVFYPKRKKLKGWQKENKKYRKIS